MNSGHKNVQVVLHFTEVALRQLALRDNDHAGWREPKLTF